MRFPFFRNRDSVKNGILISIRRTGDGFHPGLFNCDIDGSIGRCIIDLKSILGVLSFGLPKVIDITVRSDDKALVKEFEDSIMFWRCNDDG